MSIFKKKGSPYYWVDISFASGHRIRRSTGTKDKRLAQKYHDRLRNEGWKIERLGERPDYTFEEAALNLLKLSEGQRDYKVKVRHVAHWNNIFSGRILSSITTEEILKAVPDFRVFDDRPKLKLSNATKNRYLSTIKRLFTLAEQADWIVKRPHIPMFKEPKINVRWITKEQAGLLLSNISLDWLHDCCLFALMTGARANEIFTLTWDKVDLNRKTAWVTNDLAKSGKARAMPLNDDAVRLIMSRPKRRYIFCRSSGIKLTNIDHRSFTRAVKLSGLEKLKFHDLRHTWASWHVQSGTPLMVLKELGGWETLEMVQKYAHLAQSHLAVYADATEITAHLRHSRD